MAKDIDRSSTVALIIIIDRRSPGPQDDRVWQWIAAGNTVRKVQLAGIERASWIISADDFMDSYAHEGMMFRRTPVIQVLSPARHSSGGRQQGRQNINLHDCRLVTSSQTSEKQSQHGKDGPMMLYRLSNRHG